MAGTNRAIQPEAATDGPVIVLIDSQMGENIGAAARAMMNCGLNTLRLVRPRDGWPNERAQAMSSGALEKMPEVPVYDTAAAAIADCHFVLATTARPRDMAKPVFTPRAAAVELQKRHAQGQKTALLFGAERTGLTNDDLALAHGVITIPLNPAFSSLNLGQAVLLVTYEWYQQQSEASPRDLPLGGSFPVPHEKLMELYERLEGELDALGFFRDAGQKPSMIRNLRNMLARAEMSDQEVRTFHGIISALMGKKTKFD